MKQPKPKTQTPTHRKTGTDSESKSANFLSPPDFQLKVHSAPLPPPFLTQMESAFQTDFSGLTVQTNSSEAQDLGALAFTRGEAIHFAPGAYQPDSSQGQELIAHELAHIVQQRQGKVSGTDPSGINTDPQLEAAADQQGKEAVQSGSVKGISPSQAQNRNSTHHPIQRFEAPLHESITRNGLIRNEKGGFTRDETSMIYYGNWMRDVNQVFVPTAIKAVGADTLYSLLSYISFQKFGKMPTSEQLGYYICAEHIDSTVGAISGSEYGSAPTISPELQTSETVNPEGAKPRPQKAITPQSSTAPDAKAIEGKSLGLYEVDSSGVMGYLRRTNEHVEKRLTLAAERGRNEDGFLHLGAAMHSLEDLFAHSNFVEIAVSETLNTQLTDLLPDLRDKNGKVNIQTFTPDVAVKDKNGKQQMRPALATGSFATPDTMQSVGHEVIHMLRQQPPMPQNLTEIKAMNQLIQQMAKAADLNLSDPKVMKQIEKQTYLGGISQMALRKAFPYLLAFNIAVIETMFEYFPEEVKLIMHAINLYVHQNAMIPLAEKLESAVLESRVMDTSMVNILYGGRRTVNGKNTQKELENPALGQTNEDADAQKKNKGSAKKVISSLEKTPEQVVAGPSHSQIAKDHKNSVFFGLAFKLAVKADDLIRERMLEVWGHKRHSIGYGKNPAKGAGEKDPYDLREDAALQNIKMGQQILQNGFALTQRPNIKLAQKDSAKSIEDIASMLKALEKSPENLKGKLAEMQHLVRTNEMTGENAFVKSKLDAVFSLADQGLVKADKGMKPLELKAAASDFKKLAKRIEHAETLEERETIYKELTQKRAEFIQYLIGERKKGIPGNELVYAGLLTGMDRAIALNAPSFSTHQQNILSGKEHIESFPKEMQKGIQTNAKYKPDAPSSSQKGVDALIKTSRTIMDHPSSQDWWRPTVVKYIKDHPDIIREYIKARNMGMATFRD